MSARFSIFLAGLLLGIAAARADSLYTGNCADTGTTQFAPGGAATVFASAGLDSPADLAFDRSGSLYAANCFASTTARCDFTGKDLGVFASSGAKGSIGSSYDSYGILSVASDDDDTVGDFDFTANDLGALANSGSSGQRPGLMAFGSPEVPEPSTVALLATGAAAALALALRRRR